MGQVIPSIIEVSRLQMYAPQMSSISVKSNFDVIGK